MFFTSTRTVIVLIFLLHNTLSFSQNPDCPSPTFFKTFGSETQAEYGTVLARSGDGNLYLAGRNVTKTFIQKVSLAGEVIWLRDFRINPFEPITPIQIFEDSEGKIVGCGTQSQFAGATRGFVFRYDPVADLFLWAHPITSSNPLAAGILEPTSGGNYVYYQNQVLPGGETDIEILNLERATGNILPSFARRYEHISYDVLTKMVSVGGSLYGLGSAEGRDSFDNAARRLMLARFDPVNGMPLWAQLSHDNIAGQTDFLARDLLVDGDALLAAYIVDEDVNDDPANTSPNVIHLQKTDLDGNILWVKRYEFSTSILRVISVSDGYILSGQKKFGAEYFVFKVNKNGDFVWGNALNYGPAAGPNANSFGPDQSVAVADSLYFAGVATTGVGDVLFWKMLADGTMADSCGYVDSLVIQVTDIQNPVRTPIDLQQLLSTAVTTNSIVPWAANTLEEHLLCPDCSVPDPCPEGNDFNIDITDISCSGGFVNLDFNICAVFGGELPDLSITFYNGNPYTDAADKLSVYDFIAGSPDSCATIQLTDLDNLFGSGAVQNGFQIFAVVNDLGNTNTPFLSSDFPLSDVEECDYLNNLDSIIVQLPMAPTLNLGPDQVICANEPATLHAGPGFIKYQWSNGASTESTTVSFAGPYRVTVTDACGFRQIDTINIQVKSLPQVQETGAFCPGKSVTIRGFTFNQTGTFQNIIPGLNNECDTSATFFISILPYEERIEVINFCPFETVTINGVVYTDSGLVRDTVPSTTTCDTIVFYFLNQQPLPFRTYQFDICPGDSVVFNGQVYYDMGDFVDTLYSNGTGCDTVAYVGIDVLPQPEKNDTIRFCPGASVVINGVSYSMPGTVQEIIPSLTGGCDTLANYMLEWLPSPTRNEIVEFCQGTSIDIGGQTYTQPGIVQLSIPGSAGNCDTLVTYTLQYLTPPPSSLSITCPPTVNVATSPGSGPIVVNYTTPLISSNCVCPGTDLTLTSGPASGGLFAVGNTQVCYAAEDNCGSAVNCCFLVTVREELPCDSKTVGCIEYELLSITADAQQNRTYSIRVTNNCAGKLIYTSIQLPNGAIAMSPLNLSTYTSPDGRTYSVRNPNYSPFYSIRFKSLSDSIANGQSDVFEYTLPAQTNPVTFINITSRLEPQTFYAAHLNTFNCPIGSTPGSNRYEDEKFSTITSLSNTSGLVLFPNPSNGELFADLSNWQGEDLNVQIFDSRGVRAQFFSMIAGSDAQQIPLASQLPAGLYFLEIVTEKGVREVGSFVLER
ncbi:MAG: T9SS type A sorting domain-containing protein [Saprospiraceae bacterium]